MMQKKKEKKKSTSIKYPSAELLQQSCYDDYMRLLKTYDYIYTKVNIALAFCGVVMIVMVRSVDFAFWKHMSSETTNCDIALHIFMTILSVGAAGITIWAVINFLQLMKSRSVNVFDSLTIRSEEIYRLTPDEAALWLIDKYTIVTNGLKDVVLAKQQEFNSGITKLMVSIIMYVVFVIIEKGVS